MKKVVLMFVLAAFASCSSDDSGKSSNQDDLEIGLWKMTDLKYQGVSVAGYSCDKTLDFAEFLSNGSHVVKFSDLNSQGNCIQYTETGTYDKLGNVITVTQKEGNVVIFERVSNVKKLTSSEMELETISQFESFGGSDSETSTYEPGEEVYFYEK